MWGGTKDGETKDAGRRRNIGRETKDMGERDKVYVMQYNNKIPFGKYIVWIMLHFFSQSEGASMSGPFGA